MILPGGFVTRQTAASLLGVAVSTMANWANLHQEPMGVKRGKHRGYSLEELAEYRLPEG